MNKAIKCAGYVFGFAAAASGAMLAFLSVFALVIFAANATAAYLGLPENMAGLFGVTYFAAATGAVIGAVYCWSHR